MGKKFGSQFKEIIEMRGEMFAVVYNTQTGVMYTVSENGVFTLLVNSKGEPMTYSSYGYMKLPVPPERQNYFT